MKRQYNKYDKYLKVCEKQTEITRKRLERGLKSIVRMEALKVGVDMENTQHSCYPKIDNYHYDNKKVEQFVDFINTLSDDYKISFYFTMEDGKFKFW